MSQQAVDFAAADGSRLRGILQLPKNPKAAGFICLHGLTLTHGMFEELGKRAEAEGLACLRFHKRGHGDSEGDLKAQGFEDQVADAKAALAYLAASPGVDPERLGVLGFSLGGAVASVLSGRVSFKALATWGALLDTKNWLTLRTQQYGEPKNGLVEIWGGIKVSDKLFTQAVACDPFADALKFKGPFFAAHGGRDRNHPQAKSMELVEARRAQGLPAEGFFPETSGHKFQVPADWALLTRKTLDFFKVNL